MATWNVEILPKALKALAKLPPRERLRLAHRIDDLAREPRPAGAVKLKGRAWDFWRVRVGDYRVLYTLREERLTVLIVRVAHRREAYR